MNLAIFPIVLLALLPHSSGTENFNETMTTQDFERLYRAAIDISMTCYGDPGDGIGIIGDNEGSILKELLSSHFIPVALVNGMNNDVRDSARAHRLRVFVIAVDSPMNLYDLLSELKNYTWWNEDANFLIVDTRPELNQQCEDSEDYMILATEFAMLNVQFICHRRGQHPESIMILNSNPFTHRAPDVWMFVKEYDQETDEDERTGYLFARYYQERGQSCESINFAKTMKVGGYPVNFVSHMPPAFFEHDSDVLKNFLEYLEDSHKTLVKWSIDDYQWFIDNIVIAMNATAVVVDVLIQDPPLSVESGILLQPQPFSTRPNDIVYHQDRYDGMILRLNQMPILAITQHTPHMSQLDKILSVIDGNSRIGMWIVYLITFLFFKFFLGQPVTPALLNLVRLTCGSGLTTLPRNVAPTIYLTSLFMFVVTLQAIYTGNLATLLTTTVSYPNVQTKEDIPRLGYKIYNLKDHHINLISDPILDGCVVEISDSEDCIDYVLGDPLAVCVRNHVLAIYEATMNNVHLSKEPMVNEYMIHGTKKPNLLQGRIEEVLTILFEAGLYHWDPALEKLRLEFVDDDDVKKNTERRVMTLEDLSFAFVILGVGLLSSVLCFVGEIVFCRIGSKYAERRNRVRG